MKAALVTGAAGGIGSSALRLALYWERAVIAAVSSANSAKIEYSFAASESLDAMIYEPAFRK